MIAIGGRFALANAQFREKFDAAWLNLPLVGRLSRGYNAARFASTLAMLASAGVPILKALQAAAETLSNRAMRADALDALVLVREGAPLASALAQKKRFPGLLGMFARLGEQTGQLPVMLQRAATQLSVEVQRRAMALATILEPLLIVAMGGVVMLIVLAVLVADHPAQPVGEMSPHACHFVCCADRRGGEGVDQWPQHWKVSSSSPSRPGRCLTSRKRTSCSSRATTAAYMQLQLDRLDQPAKPGVAFSLVRKLLAFNEPGTQRVEVVILSRNDPVSGMRVFRSAQHYGLPIQRGSFTRGAAALALPQAAATPTCFSRRT